MSKRVGMSSVRRMGSGLAGRRALDLAVASSAIALSAAGPAFADTSYNVSVSLSAPTRLVVGTPSSVTSVLSQPGGTDPLEVTYALDGPGALTKVTADTTADPDATYSFTAAAASCRYPTLNPEYDATTILEVTASAAGTLTLHAHASTTAGPDPYPDDDNATATMTSVVVGPAAMTATEGYVDENGRWAPQVTVHLTNADGSNAAGESIAITQSRLDGTDPRPSSTTLRTSTGGLAIAVVYPEFGDDTLLTLHHVATEYTGEATTGLAFPPKPTAVQGTLTPTTVTAGHPTTVSATVVYADTGAAVPSPSGRLVLQSRPTGQATWVDDPTVTSGSGSNPVTFNPAPLANTDYRVAYRGDGIYTGSSFSPTLAVLVAPALALAVSPIIIPPGGRTTLTATSKPSRAGLAVELQQQTATGWATVSTHQFSTTSTTSWSFTYPANGRHTWRLHQPADTNQAESYSPPKSLLVTSTGRGSPTDFAWDTYNGRPVRWNPCAAIHYRVNLSHAPAGAAQDTHESLRRITLASGLQFVYDGTTAYVPIRGGHQPAPLVIAWATTAQSSWLRAESPDVAGVGGTSSTLRHGQPVVTQGFAVLRQYAGTVAGFGAGQTTGSLLMHEIGHAVGLGHAPNGRYQIMAPVLTDMDATMFGAGDLRGLHLLGRAAGCI